MRNPEGQNIAINNIVMQALISVGTDKLQGPSELFLDESETLIEFGARRHRTEPRFDGFSEFYP